MNPDETVAAGLDFLSATNRNGRWRAFHLYPGISDEWVTAYIAATLAEADTPGAKELVSAASAGLANRQRPDGRFGFNARAIGDADSTLWALRLAAADRGEPEWDRASAITAVSEHVRPNGGIATYAEDEPIRTIIEAPAELPLTGWCAVHPCVTAVAATIAETAEGALDYLIRTQRTEGSWPAYWWPDQEYTVAHAAEAMAVQLAENLPQHRARRFSVPGGSLSESAGELSVSAGSLSESAGDLSVPAGSLSESAGELSEDATERALRRAATWGRQRLARGPVRTALHPDGSPFATALALRAALSEVRTESGSGTGVVRTESGSGTESDSGTGVVRTESGSGTESDSGTGVVRTESGSGTESDTETVLDEAVRWLCRQLRIDGSWEPSAVLRVPRPYDQTPEVSGGTVWIPGGRKEGAVILDLTAVFSTATVVSALVRAAGR